MFIELKIKLAPMIQLFNRRVQGLQTRNMCHFQYHVSCCRSNFTFYRKSSIAIQLNFLFWLNFQLNRCNRGNRVTQWTPIRQLSICSREEFRLICIDTAHSLDGMILKVFGVAVV